MSFLCLARVTEEGVKTPFLCLARVTEEGVKMSFFLSS